VIPGGLASARRFRLDALRLILRPPLGTPSVV
jgi:hypothetical protein